VEVIMAQQGRGKPLNVPPGDGTLDQALERIAELSRRLWAAQAAHRPGPVRYGQQRQPRCVGCRQRYPCPTARALDPRQLHVA
jgi:hypothetical protein